MPLSAQLGLDEGALRVLAEERSALLHGADLAVRFPGIPRRAGKAPLAAGTLDLPHGPVQRGSWRTCDAVAALLLQDNGGAPRARELFEHGDRDERLMATRALLQVADAEALRNFLALLQTSNDQALFEAAFLDGEQAAALLDMAAWNRLLLKVAFIGLPVDRLPGWERRCNASIVQMLSDLRSERVAAGRPVWSDTERVCGVCVVPPDARV